MRMRRVQIFQLTSILPKVLSQLCLRHCVKVWDLSNIHIPTCPGLNSLRERGAERSRMLAPPDFQTTRIDSQTGIDGVIVEVECAVGVDKGDELNKSQSAGSSRKLGQSAQQIRLTAIFLSVKCLTCCNCPPLILLHSSSVVVPGIRLPK